MNAASFFLALARRSRYVSNARDPLGEAVQFLDQHGDTAEGRMLRKVIETLISGRGDFAESDVWLFSAEGLALANALVEARVEGIAYTQEQWLKALDTGDN